MWPPCGCLAAKFDSCNSLLSSVHSLLVNILRCVRLYIKRKKYYYDVIGSLMQVCTCSEIVHTHTYIHAYMHACIHIHTYIHVFHTYRDVNPCPCPCP